MLLPQTYRVNEAGHMEIGGCDLLQLAREYGTPLYVYDEDTIRGRLREYRDALRATYPGASQVLYAGKAFLTLQVARLVEAEGCGLDLVSGGELHLATRAGFPMELVYLAGNNKSADEVGAAARQQVGALVVDSELEIDFLGQLPSGTGARAMLRVSPGVKPDTHEHIATGQLDSKFGFPAATGQAMAALRRLLATPRVDVVGLHAHIGSQVYDLATYQVAAERMLDFMAQTRAELGFEAAELSLGGGFGIAHVAADHPPAPDDFARTVATAVATGARRRGLALPKLLLEPGRSVIGPAGVTLYTVGAIKEIPGVRTYVAVDGGMGDNIRPKLYGARYQALKAKAPEAEATTTVTIAGRYCESTDIIIEDARTPPLESGDVVCIPATGAYALAMSSNYNYNVRPAVIMVRDGSARLIRRRETYDDLLLTEV